MHVYNLSSSIICRFKEKNRKTRGGSEGEKGACTKFKFQLGFPRLILCLPDPLDLDIE